MPHLNFSIASDLLQPLWQHLQQPQVCVMSIIQVMVQTCSWQKHNVEIVVLPLFRTLTTSEPLTRRTSS